MEYLQCNYEDWRLIYERAIEYITKENELHHLQMIYPVYSQNKKRKGFPCILYVTDSKDTYQNIPGLSAFAQRGYAVVIMENDQKNHNIMDAIDYLTKHAGQYNIDIHRILLWTEGMVSNCLHIQDTKTIKARMDYDKTEDKFFTYNKSQKDGTPCLAIHGGMQFWIEEVYNLIEDFFISYI